MMFPGGGGTVHTVVLAFPEGYCAYIVGTFLGVTTPALIVLSWRLLCLGTCLFLEGWCTKYGVSASLRDTRATVLAFLLGDTMPTHVASFAVTL